jgi:translation initiation factor IF-1
MAREGAIEVEGAVVEVLPKQMYRVELANGHRVLAFLTGKARARAAGFALKDRVRLALSPYDLSTGRIIVEEETI